MQRSKDGVVGRIVAVKAGHNHAHYLRDWVHVPQCRERRTIIPLIIVLYVSRILSRLYISMHASHSKPNDLSSY
jgi:hypothetical protein